MSANYLVYVGAYIKCDDRNFDDEEDGYYNDDLMEWSGFSPADCEAIYVPNGEFWEANRESVDMEIFSNEPDEAITEFKKRFKEELQDLEKYWGHIRIVFGVTSCIC